MSETNTLEASNRQRVEQHFEDFVNRRDLAAIDRNMSEDFLDHDGPDGRQIGRDADRAMMAAMHKRFPDLKIVLRDVIAEGDKVAVRAVWSGVEASSGQRMSNHGFVLWRLENGRIVERWATVTPMRPVAAGEQPW